jgi:hypothetical protein
MPASAAGVFADPYGAASVRQAGAIASLIFLTTFSTRAWLDAATRPASESENPATSSFETPYQTGKMTLLRVEFSL